MSAVTVVGSINVDLTCYLERWPKVGETVHSTHNLTALGGKGANQAVAAARLGAKVNLIGAVGADTFGPTAEQWVRDYNVAPLLTVPQDSTTGLAFIDVVPSGQNIIRLNAGANGMLTPADIRAHASTLKASKVLLLQNEIPLDASLAAAAIGRAAGALVVMDPAPAPKPFWDAQTLAAFDVVTPNAQEAGMITGRTPKTLGEAKDTAEALKNRGIRGCIITMGSLGIAWSINGQSGVLEAMKVDAVDTVAAGDCFNGAFSAALASGMSITQALQQAVIAASLATTRRGAASSVPTYSEVIQARALMTKTP